jgi:hypothetical protein
MSLRPVPAPFRDRDTDVEWTIGLHAECVRLVLLVVTALVSAAGLATALAHHWLGHDKQLGLRLLLDLDGEGNLPTWWSSFLLLVAAALLGVIAGQHSTRGGGNVRHWAALAAIFLALSVDETAQVHELVGKHVHRLLATRGTLRFAWVIPGALFVAVVGFTYLRFLGRLPPATRRRVAVAGAVYVGGALGLELLESAAVERWGQGAAWAALSTLQEIAEMVGVVLFIHALLAHLASEGRGLALRVTSAAHPGRP